MANTDFTFRIKDDEYSKYASLASSQTLDEELCENYSETAIIKAKQLKAKHGTNYTDGYYLDYAKSLELQEIIATNREIHKRRVVFCEIKDVDWAGYSYEEILAMEKDGYQIPEDILLWAHAQQEADVTDYVVVSDATIVSDNTTDSTGEPQDELSNLQTKAKQNVTKTELALEEAATNIEEYNLAADKVQQIRKKEKFFYKAMLDDLTKDKKEWEELKEKKENGKISKFEEIKLKKLSKKFENQDTGIVNKIKENNADLENFLSSLDGLNEDISENLSLAQDTIKAGKELGEYEKTYNESQLPVATSGAIFDGNGQTSDTLYEVKGAELSELAIEKGQELEEFSNSLSSDLTTGKNAKLADFATDYTNRAAEFKNEEQEPQENSEDTQQEENNKQKLQNFDVLMNFSYPNSIIATATTLISTNDVTARDIRVTKDDKDLRKELSIARKDSQNLAKESTKAEDKLAENQAKEDETKAELETIQQETETSKSNNDTSSPDLVEENQGTETDTIAQPVDDKNAKKQELLNELGQQQEETQSIKDLVKKASIKSAQTTSKGEKLTKALTRENNNLETRNNNNEEVSEKTTVVGVGTVARGFMDTALGTTLQSTGVSLMASVLTWSQGVVLFMLGVKLQEQGEKEITYGSIAMGTGIAGTIISEVADGTNKNADRTIKEANQLYKSNNQTIQEASQNIGENVSGEQNAQDTNTNTEATQDSNANTSTDETINSEAPLETIPQEADGTTTLTTNDSVLDSDTTVEETNNENNNEQNNTTVEEADNEITNEQNNTTAEETETTTPQETSEKEDLTGETASEEENDDNKIDNENETTEENKATQPKKEDKEPTVDMEFSAPNAVKATETTIETTADMIRGENQMRKLSKTVEIETKQSQRLIKDIDSESAKAVIEHQKNSAESEAITAQHAAAQSELETAQTAEQADAAQQTMANLSTQLNTTIEKDGETNTNANKTISNSIRQLSKFRSNTKIMNKELATLDKTISNQLDVSAKTMAVGIGTTGVGVLDSYTGTGLIISGMILMSNIFTYSMGVAQLIAGEIILAKGVSEVTTGTVATATGATGIATNAITQAVSNDSDEVLEDANKQNKELEEKAGISEDEINSGETPANIDETSEDSDPEAETETETETTEQALAVTPEENDVLNEITQLAASASTNANITESILTDDKADKKLSRFNTESIIESKKKMKKVQAVSASSGGKA